MIGAVVLAGGGPDEVSARQPGAPNKAFLEVGGVAMVQRVLAALRAGGAGPIVAVAPATTRARPELAGADAIAGSGAHITDSLRAGLASFPDPTAPVLIVASDLPVLSPAAVEDFIVRVRDAGAAVAYGCVERSVHLREFPQFPHTWARLRDGVFCGGGLAALRPDSFALLEHFLERLGAARKAPLRLASLFGRRVLLRYALGRLTIAQAEARGSELLGAPVRAIVSPYADTALNVDRAGDVDLARALFPKANASA